MILRPYQQRAVDALKGKEMVINFSDGRKYEFTEKTVERFMTHVEKDHVSGCWIWRANRTLKGYGRFSVSDKKQGVMVQSHRFSYSAFIGEINGTNCVLHTCDNPSCVNPSHLFQGTNQENVDDKMKKGRFVSPGTYTKNYAKRGETNWRCKLKDSEVEEIKKLRKSGMSCRSIAKLFNVTHSHISKITRGTIRQH